MSERKRRPKKKLDMPEVPTRLRKTRRPSAVPVLPKKQRPPFTTRATRKFSGKQEGRSRKLSLMLAKDKAFQAEIDRSQEALEEIRKKVDRTERSGFTQGGYPTSTRGTLPTLDRPKKAVVTRATKMKRSHVRRRRT